MAEAPSLEQSLRIVRKVANFNGGHIADDLRWRPLRMHLRRLARLRLRNVQGR